MVRFMVNERGVVINAEVLNKKEVHSKLADEALRVIASSPPWAAATDLWRKNYVLAKAGNHIPGQQVNHFFCTLLLSEIRLK